jgi:hypothetical protein
MTEHIRTTAPRRTQPIAAHAYTLPVVRELPPRPIDATPGARWQW